MPLFKYLAKTPDGKNKKGNLQVASYTDAVLELRKQGLIILSLKEIAERKLNLVLFKPKAGQRIKADQLSIFTRQLAVMIGAGIPLLEALEILREQAESKSFKLTIEEIIAKVRGGADFSQALEDYPRIFNRVYVNMIRAGEAGGQLETILNRLAEYIESTQALKRDIKAAMTYPIISLTLIILIVIGLLIFVIPKFQDIFRMLEIKLPLPTQIVLKISNLTVMYWYIWLGGIVTLVVGFMLFSRTSVGEYYLHWLILKLPVFGDLAQKVAISRFSITLSTLIQSGVPILGALEIVATTTGNRIVEETINQSRENVRRGETLSEPLSRSKIFPPMVTRMISIGEKSGALELLLGKVSEFYNQQVKATLTSLTSLIEPMLIAIMGVLVGGMVVAIFLPIITIQQAVMRR